MSTRWYPIYNKTNPQLRIFLPNFWMKLVKQEEYQEQRDNVVVFHVPIAMTRIDIKNYLEKIYKVPVIKVNTRIALGKTKTNECNKVIKEDDIKVAYVHLPRYESFKFPNIFDTEHKKTKETREKETMEAGKQELKTYLENCKANRPNQPGWFRF